MKAAMLPLLLAFIGVAHGAEADKKDVARAVYLSETILCASIYALHAKADNISAFKTASDGATYVAAMIMSKNSEFVGLEEFSRAKSLREYYEGLLVQDHMDQLKFYLLNTCNSDTYLEAGLLFQLKYKDLTK